MGHLQTPAFHGALQGEAPGPKEEPSCAEGQRPEHLAQLGMHTMPSPSWGMHLWTFQILMAPATSLNSLPRWKWNPSALCSILCPKNCHCSVNILFPGKSGCLFFFTVLECFWAKMHRKKTYFRWSQQQKYGQFRKAVQGILVHHCTGWSKCLQLLYFPKFVSVVCRFII